ncbi:MAG: O-antigen ligase domain-containing protein [Candidatus Magasanikbacteria bacterium]|nr:O-antigen ligase domain-containing protein [Candidatus Magasanikbacteria bacterium]
MTYLLLTLFSLAFAHFAWTNFRLATGLFIIALPAYLIRLRLGPLPSTILEVMFGILFLIWIIKFARADWPHIKSTITNHKYFFISLLLFFLTSIASIFISDMWYYSLGQWRAYFLEPTLVFVMLVGRIAPQASSPTPTPPKRGMLTPSDLIWFLALSTVSINIFGILQYFTGWHIGNVDWIAIQTHRVTSFFLSPNAVGLYLGPIVMLLLGVIASEVRASRSPSLQTSHNKGITTSPSFLGLLVMTLLAVATLLLTKSLGALVAVAVGTLLFLFLIGRKKTALVGVFIGICLVLSTYRLGLLQNKSQSSANRLTLWTYTETFLSKSPKNFVFGAGIGQFFRKIQKPYYNVREMERLIYPHNIFLNFWTEIGLIGMLSFFAMYYWLLAIGWRIYKHSNKILGASLLAALVVFLVHGLIDVPYFKNDLAILFWILAACVIASEPPGERRNPLT